MDDDASSHLYEQFTHLPECRNALTECPKLAEAAAIEDSEFGFHIAEEFHTREQDRRWVPELLKLVEKHGGGQGKKPNSPKVNYHVVQVNRAPCACLYIYPGTNRKLLVWGVNESPRVVEEMMHHFMTKMHLQDNHEVPGCLVINVYKHKDHHIPFHTDKNEMWGAMDKPTNIFTWNLGTHAVFEMKVTGHTPLAKKLVGGKANEKKLLENGYHHSWIVSPGSMTLMSGHCQSSCLHRVPEPSEAMQLPIVKESRDYTHHSAEDPRVALSLRCIRKHDPQCGRGDIGCRWLRGLSIPQAQGQASAHQRSDTSFEHEIPASSWERAANPKPEPVAQQSEPCPGKGQASSLIQSDESFEDQIPASSRERAANPKPEAVAQQSEPCPGKQRQKRKLHQAKHEEGQASSPIQSDESFQDQIPALSSERAASPKPEPVAEQSEPKRKKIRLRLHKEVQLLFHRELRLRLQEQRSYGEALELTEPSVIQGYNRKSCLYRVLLPLSTFRNMLRQAMFEHTNALERGKWCFTMTPEMRDAMWWIPLPQDENSDFKHFNWTQENLPPDSYCSLDKLETSMQYQQGCYRITHCKAPTSQATARHLHHFAYPVNPRQRAELISIGEWSAFITDVKYDEQIQYRNGMLELPPLPQDWPSWKTINEWPMVCWIQKPAKKKKKKKVRFVSGASCRH